ncbi:hypothetical protein GF374_02150 [Candidatus Woesearchaeota archaeon]|nr:hypothetical protein [Candidatus Woesearchaeota archaeon]
MAKARVPRTNQMNSVLRKHIYKDGWEIQQINKIRQNRWKVFLKHKQTSKTRTAIIDKKDLRTLRKFKSVIRHQV